MQHTITRAETASVVALAIMAGCVPALQPLLLGSLLAEGRISASLLGRIGTIEAAGMLVGTVAAAILLRPTALRPIATVAVASIALANGATTIGGTLSILVARTIAGLAGGVLLWLLVGVLTRSAAPGRLFAVYVTAQAILALLLSTMFATLVIPTLHAAGAYRLLGALALVLLVPAATMIPRRLAPLTAGGGTPVPTARGLVGLAAVAAFLAGITALWVYLLPLGEQLGQSAATMRRLIAIAVAFQIAGGLAATWLVQQFRAIAASACAAGACGLLVVAVALAGSSAAGLTVAICLFSLLWMFAPPFHLPMLLELDPSGRSALYIGTAQLGGAAIGPLIASFAVSRNGYGAVIWVSLSLFAASLIGCASMMRILTMASRPAIGGDTRSDAMPGSP